MSNPTRAAAEGTALVLAPLVGLTSNPQLQESEMPKFFASQIAVVNCPTNTQTKTRDGNVHTMVRAWPLAVLPEGKEDLKSAIAAVLKTAEEFVKIGNGEEIILLGADGKEIGKPVVPTDDIPGANEVTEENKDGEVIKTVNHGTNFAKTLPISGKDFIDAFNAGVKNFVLRKGVAAITEEVREGSGQRGRAAITFDPTKLA